jgi:RNA polymerase sigma-B factor
MPKHQEPETDNKRVGGDLAAAFAEEERSEQLFRRLPQDPEARDELVRLHYPLAKYLGRRFAGRGEPVEDLIQVASLGLIKAIDRFDSQRGVKFTTYATATIVGELKRHFRDKGWALSVPRRLKEIGLEVSNIVSTLCQELGRSPTVREIAQQTGLTEDEVVEAMDAVHAYSTGSLDIPGDHEMTEKLARLGSNDESIEVLEAWASLAPAIKTLPNRERHILYLRFFKGLTQMQIAEELGMSQMHVSRLLSRTLQVVRDTANPDE